MDSGETKRKILFAAKSEFASKGFTGARMNSIAASAGVNQALIHYYFSTKDSLYKKIFEELLDDFSNRSLIELKQEIGSWDVSVEIKICAIVYLIATSKVKIYDDESHRIIAHEIADGGNRISELVSNNYNLQLTLVNKLIMEGVEKGIFHNSNTLMLSVIIVSFMRNIVHIKSFCKPDLLKDFQGDQDDTVYYFMLEFIFKALSPEWSSKVVPELDDVKKKGLRSILNKSSYGISNI